MIKGLAVLFSILIVLMGLLIWAKSQPGPQGAQSDPQLVRFI